MNRLQAELYALTHRGNAGDAQFYAKSCALAGSVLELGVGYGRLLPALSERGQLLVGLERDPALLRMAQRTLPAKARAGRGSVRLVLGDMRSFELVEKFDCILLPYNALYCLLNRRSISNCLERVKNHLAPGGSFVFDVWNAGPFHQESHRGRTRDEPGPILSFVHRGQLWDVFEQSRLRRRLQRLDVVYRYVSRRRGTQVDVPIQQRYAPSSEIFELLERTGFSIRATYGDFSGRRFRGNSAQLVVRAQVTPIRTSAGEGSVRMLPSRSLDPRHTAAPTYARRPTRSCTFSGERDAGAADAVGRGPGKDLRLRLSSAEERVPQHSTR